MTRGFMLLGVGFVFALADLGVGPVNLLPDLVGYLLLALGAHLLSQFATRFATARNFAWALVGVSLAALLLPPVGTAALEVVRAVLAIFLIWTLLGGIMQFTSDRERRDLAKHAALYRRIYVGLGIVTLGFVQLAHFAPDAAGFYLTVMGLASLVLLFFVLRLLWVVNHDLGSAAVV